MPNEFSIFNLQFTNKFTNLQFINLRILKLRN